jgi:DNA-binding transcriptional ArsR family regulator
MARASETRPEWAEEFLKNLREPTKEELKQRQAVLRRLRKLREKLDIRPLTTTDLVREMREEN